MPLNQTQIEEAKKKLTPEQYNVCFLKGTEPPGSGRYYKNTDPGTYECTVCGQELFSSDTKYDSTTGWPSFWDPISRANVKIEDDFSLGMQRLEVRCASCGAHLGHVFPDGPTTAPDGRKATGERYCINSLSLNFRPNQ